MLLEAFLCFVVSDAEPRASDFCFDEDASQLPFALQLSDGLTRLVLSSEKNPPFALNSDGCWCTNIGLPSPFVWKLFFLVYRRCWLIGFWRHCIFCSTLLVISFMKMFYCRTGTSWRSCIVCRSEIVWRFLAFPKNRRGFDRFYGVRFRFFVFLFSLSSFSVRSSNFLQRELFSASYIFPSCFSWYISCSSFSFSLK